MPLWKIHHPVGAYTPAEKLPVNLALAPGTTAD